MIWGLLLHVFLGVAKAQEDSQPKTPQIPAVQDQTTELPMPIQCGLVTKFAGHKIADGCLQTADNVTFDRDAGVQRRQGYGQFNTTAITGSQPVRRTYPFKATDGTEYVMAVSSFSLVQSGTSGSFSTIAGLTGLSSTENTACKQGLGRFWCTNSADGLFYWDGTSTAAVSAGPKGTLIDIFRNRVLIANVSGNQSSLYGSGHLDGTNWTTASASTSPFIIRVYGSNDGENITCLMGTHNDAYLIGTKNRLFALYGFDNTDFVIREISREFGCLDQTSVQEMDGDLYWLSRRGIERFRGTTIDWKVSYPVIDLIQAIIDAAGNTRNAIDTTQSDFQAGTLNVSGAKSAMSATISPGNVVPSTWGVTENSSTTFAAGTLTTVSTNVVNALNIYQNGSGVFINSGAESCTPPGGSSGSPGANWISTCFGPVGCWSCSGGTSPFGSQRWFSNNSATCPENMTFDILDTNNNVLTSTIVAVTAALGNTVLSINTSTFSVSQIKLRASDSKNSSVMTSSPFLRPNNVTLTYNSGSSNCQGQFDLDESITLNTSGNSVSQCYDTGISTPVWGLFSVMASSDTNSGITFQTQVATSCSSTFDSLVTATNGSQITSATKEAIRYKSSFTISSATNTPASLTSANLTAETTGYFISQCRNPGTAITSWGLFQCNGVANNGSFTFAISTAASCNAATRSTATWNAQTNNTVISVATSAFVAYRVLFGLDVATQVPTLQDCTINWEEGSARPEVASGIHEHRYHIFYTTGTTGTPVNSEALVLDQFDRWSHWNDIPARSAAQYRGDLLIGDGASTGKIYRLYTGNDDNGSSFTTKIRTKDFDLGGNWRARKTFGPLWLELSPASDATSNVAVGVSAYVDVANKYSIGTVNLTEDSGVVAARVPWPLDNQASGRYISIELSDTGIQPWRFYRGALRHKILREE